MYKNSDREKVAIVIITHKEGLKEHEKISLDFLEKNLMKYDKFLIIRKSHNKIDPRFKKLKFKVMRLDDKYFTSKGHDKLMKGVYFYNLFKDYEYILKHELDCLVFKDQLDYFCSLGYDYIGAPSIRNQIKKIKNVNRIKIRNGGFSLRKVKSFINVAKKDEKSNRFWFMRFYLENFFWFTLFRIRGLITRKRTLDATFTFAEDIFWSIGAKKINPNFKVASFYMALSFSFENNIPLCLKMNNNNLPFGCHAFQCEKNLKEWKKIESIKYMLNNI